MQFKCLLRSASLAILFLALILTSAVAGASCSKPNWAKAGATGGHAPSKQAAGIGLGNRNGSIVGLWRVYYSIDDAAWMQSFDQWHADGNEFEVANAAPGVVCQGTYVRSSPGTYKVTHVGWNFDFSGNLLGYFVETQINSVSEDGNGYTGTFEFNFYLMDGTPDSSNPSFSGTLEATRISAG
jgi:hypothetical protein